jgi:hypothetical protein
LDISGNEINEEHPEKINSKFVKDIIFHFEISGKDIKDEHP